MDFIREKFNQISRWDNEIDEYYHRIAVNIGISDTAFRILYAISETDEKLTQITLGERLCLPKQTINSAIIKLQKDGYIDLEQLKTARNIKSVSLTEKGQDFCKTEKGQDFCKKHIIPVLQMEERAYSVFTDDELQQFISLYEKQFHILKMVMTAYLKEESQ